MNLRDLPPIYETDHPYDLGRARGLAERDHRAWLGTLLIASLTYAAGVISGWILRALYAPLLEPGWAILLALVVLIPVACVKRRPPASSAQPFGPVSEAGWVPCPACDVPQPPRARYCDACGEQIGGGDADV